MKLFLIDGHALIFKMYYAFLGRPMVNGKGVDTSILFGFTKYILELIERENPSHIAVSFDPPGGTFRNKMYPQYKANRGETPQLVIDALEPLTRIVTAMGIPVLMIPGFEADDVIGSMAKRCARDGFTVYMVTPDKDYGQLIEENILQYRPAKGGENEILGPKEVCEKWGIDKPLQVIDILALCGDASDNVPGVQGIGPVGASKLLLKYGSVDGIYAHLDELTPRQRGQFEAASDHIDLSRKLVTIKTDIPLEVTAGQMLFRKVASEELLSLFSEFEFGSLTKKLFLMGFSKDSSSPASSAEVRDTASASISWETVNPDEFIRMASSCESVSLKLYGDRLFIALSGEGKMTLSSAAPETFRDLLENPDIRKTGIAMKSLMNALHSRGIELQGPLEDAELMHYIISPEQSHSLEQLCRTYLGVELEPEDQDTQGSLFDEQPDEGEETSCKAVALLRPLCRKLREELERSGLSEVYDRIEEPLLRVLSRMEQTGVKIDLGELQEYIAYLRSQVQQKEALVRELADEPALNVSSPKQVGEVIFEKMALDPKAKKPRKGNWPTDEQTLLELSDRSPIIGAILDFRSAKKLLSTYIEPLPGYISPADGRVHTTFNQTLTATGRLSSSNPNLQNIPVRTEEGRQIRKAFVAGDSDSVIMSADYSQIELRIMAHLCGDDHMREAFTQGVDVHSATAAKIFRKSVDEVTSQERRVAKTANFGIMYGISAFGLSQRLGCSRQDARQIIDDYFASFPSIRSFIDRTLQEARANGYVQTIFGRRRYTPEIESSNAQIRAFAERNAVNAPIQGSAADIIKLAMTGVDSSLRREGLRSRMVLQIHDELMLEVPRGEIEKARDILVWEMENVVKLSVPLEVECSYGKNWLEAH